MSISAHDTNALVISYIYATSLLITGELLYRFLRWPRWITRKFVHIFAGLWVWFCIMAFESKLIGLIPFITFIPMNLFLVYVSIFRSIGSKDRNFGTVYFAISIASLLYFFQDRQHLAMVGIMDMTLGDAVACLVGTSVKAWRAKKYEKKETKGKTLVGSLACAVACFWASMFTLWAMHYPGGAWSYLLLSVVSMLVGTIVEACSPPGMDNLFMPILVTTSLWLLGF
ncbi:uncharacterized protein VTP21DRAFT_1191 [Calcarisporiella thermophila]|uniref:uncharacterized protein n=1 Tax=Calcarisporiella thermophila TaxID=911321 RepID=UPI0037447C35